MRTLSIWATDTAAMLNCEMMKRGRPALAALETAAEVVERVLAVGLLADDRIDLEPDQFAFRIVIEAPPPT